MTRKEALLKHRDEYLYKKVAYEIELELLKQYKDDEVYATRKEKSFLGKEVEKKITVADRKNFLLRQIAAIDRIIGVIDAMINKK